MAGRSTTSRSFQLIGRFEAGEPNLKPSLPRTELAALNYAVRVAHATEYNLVFTPSV
jgi:hypothetical protein